MNILSINSLTSLGLHGSCLSLYDKTRHTCRRVAELALDKLSYIGACIGYKMGSAGLLNAAFELGNGISLEKALVNDLHLAAVLGTVVDVKSALAKGENVNAKDCKGNTPLHYAVLHKNEKIIGSLISNGADIHAINLVGKTPLALFYSRQVHNPSTSSYAQQFHNSCVLLYNKTGDTCRQVTTQAFDKLSDLGTYISYKIGSIRLLNAACKFEKRLLNELHLTAIFGTIADVKSALAKGENVNAKNHEGETPLHYAAASGNKEIVKELIVNGAEINAKSLYGNTPLHYAAINAHNEIVKELIVNGAEINTKDLDGMTPLHYAAFNAHNEIVKELIINGAEINTKDLDGWTPLHYATFGAHNEIVRTLVANKADINASATDGNTPLNTPRLDILSILHNAESHPAFTSEAALHAYFDKLFPPSREVMQKDLKWLEAMIKKLDAGKDPWKEFRSRLAKCGPISFKRNAKFLLDLQSKHALASKSLSVPPIDMILNCLIQNSPLFSKIWESANLHDKWKLHEVDLISEKTALARTLVLKSSIHIEKSGDIFSKAYGIIFEALNAFQSKRFKTIEELAQTGMLSREEYSLLIEYLEQETLVWTHRVIGWQEPSSFADQWKWVNTPWRVAASYNLTHADEYRKQWDRLYGFPYLKKHPELRKEKVSIDFV